MYIKRIEKTDLNPVYDLQCQAFPENLHEDISLFANIVDQTESIASAVYINNKIAGYVFGYPTNRERTDFHLGPKQETPSNKDTLVMYLHDLSIHPDFQGQGIGKKLFHHLEQTTLAKGYKSIMAIAIEGKLSFWERLGFQAFEELDYHGTKSTRIEKILALI